MQKQISWDPTLIKKFGSSNHCKLLNQLRNEVKKYPLKRTKTNIEQESPHKNNIDTINPNKLTTSSINNINQNPNESKTIYKSNHNIFPSPAGSNSELLNDKTNNKANTTDKTLITTNIKFNNSKNFSIYNNKSEVRSVNENNIKPDKQANNNDISQDNSLSFKDRLSQIDMK